MVIFYLGVFTIQTDNIPFNENTTQTKTEAQLFNRELFEWSLDICITCADWGKNIEPGSF